MEKMKMETPNLVEQNIDFIASRFPNCITETKDKNGKTKKAINFDLLKQMLSSDVLEGVEAYEFTWVGKKASIVEANKPIRKTLRPCPEESVDWDNTENLYIEGDNLEVLKLLQESYLGKVKMIYIDPPYNTGNDFIYPDSYIMDNDDYNSGSGYYDKDGNVNYCRVNDALEGKYHSDWCSMIYSRILVARNLLSEDGIIFISVDDHELQNLMKCCEDIFGNHNFVSLLSVENNPKGRKNSKFVSVSNDYCLIYAKNKEMSRFVENIPKDVNDLAQDADGNFVHNSGKRVLVGENSFNSKVDDFSSDKNYSVYYNQLRNDIIIKQEHDVNDANTELINQGYERYFSYDGERLVENTYTITKIKELFDSNSLDFKNGKIYEKNMSTTIRIKSMLVNKSYNAVVNGTVKSFSIDLKTTSAGTALKELFKTEGAIFSAPKNVSFLRTLITLLDDKNALILDFFSGSSSTAQAVLEQNAEDNGHRKYVMVQVQEDLNASMKRASTKPQKEVIKNAINYLSERKLPLNICELAKERIRRASKKIKAENPLTTQNLDTGFRVFKLDDSNMKEVYYSAQDYSQSFIEKLESNIKEDRTNLDLLFGCLLEWGLPLSLPYTSEKIDGFTVHTYNDGDLIACFNENISDEVIKAIAKRKPLRAVFRDGSFADSPAKINVTEIFKLYAPDTRVKVI